MIGRAQRVRLGAEVTCGQFRRLLKHENSGWEVGEEEEMVVVVVAAAAK